MATAFHQPWENVIFPLAYEAEHQPLAPSCQLMNDRCLLDRAYAYCDSITSSNSRTFYLASSLLPAAKRRAMRALYAFCRLSDDLVDCPQDNTEERLAAWRRRVLTSESSSQDLVTIAWTDTRYHYRIPLHYAEQLIEGVGRDLYQTRYRTFEDVVGYAYGVASTVGLMSMHIIGFEGEQAIPYAIKLGIAMQITNILRDIGEDWANGRLYLPLEEMAAFGVSEADLNKGQVNDRWRALLRFQIERNHRLYIEANPGIAFLNKDGRFAVAAASDLYRAILGDIEAHDYDVFKHRAHVNAWGKVRRLPGIWWRNR
jgi:phytoene synthase